MNSINVFFLSLAREEEKSQSSHWYALNPWWIEQIWSFRLLAWAEAKGQILHWYGFNPLWNVLTWFFRLSDGVAEKIALFALERFQLFMNTINVSFQLKSCCRKKKSQSLYWYGLNLLRIVSELHQYEFLA